MEDNMNERETDKYNELVQSILSSNPKDFKSILKALSVAFRNSKDRTLGQLLVFLAMDSRSDVILDKKDLKKLKKYGVKHE